MADLIDMDDEDLPADRRLRLSMRWRWIATYAFSPSPDWPHACFGVGFFLGDKPLFNDAVYWQPQQEEVDPVPPGYFKACDDDCRLLNGLDALLYSNERFDFEDMNDPFFRLVIAPDAFNPEIAVTSDDQHFDVLAVIYWGGNWHGQALGEAGPAVRLSVTRDSLVRFFRELLEDAYKAGICGEVPRRILRERFRAAV